MHLIAMHLCERAVLDLKAKDAGRCTPGSQGSCLLGERLIADTN